MSDIYLSREQMAEMISQGEIFMSTREAAEYTGISRSTFEKEYKYYKGKTPRITRYRCGARVYYLKRDLDIFSQKVKNRPKKAEH